MSGIFFWGIPYTTYDVQPCLDLWSNWYYIPHIASAAILVITAILPKRKREKKVEASSKSSTNPNEKEV